MERFAHRHRLTLGYAILVIAAVAALALSFSNQARIEEEARKDAVTLCQSNNALKDVILTLIERLSEEGGTDFTAVDGFDDLDPPVQDYLRVLGAATGPSSGESRSLAIAREVLVPLDCAERIAGERE